MKLIQKLMVFSLIIGAMFTSCAQSESKIQNLNVDGFEAELLSKKKMVILDVRTPDEFSEGYIDGAININYYNDNFESKCLKSIPKDAAVYVYCKAGSRSASAAKLLAKNNYNVINLKGGFDAWKRAKKKIKK